MAGKLVLIIAGTGQGKTTKVKKLIDGKKCMVFDVNGEYNELPFDVEQDRSRFYNPDVREFLKVVPEKHQGTICVFEEATGFFAGAAQKETKKIIVGKRHPVDYGGRDLLFVFHTIGSVPPFLIETADYIILGKTADEPNRVKTKSSKLYGPFLRVQKYPKYQFMTIKNI